MRAAVIHPLLGDPVPAGNAPAPGSGRRPAWPCLEEGGLAASRVEAGADLPPLRFDEAELAAVAAAVALDGRRRARAEALEELAARRDRAVALAAEALADAARQRRSEDERVRDEVVRLVGAVARALVLDARPERLAGALEGLLRGIPEAATAARVLVGPEAVEALRASLSDIAARAGFPGGIEVAGDPLLPPGGVQLLWADGWSEHVPDQVHARIQEILAAHGAADDGPALRMPAPPTISANEDGEQP
jgi:hypothetical protein